MIYRVTIKTTGSLQPGSGGTFWGRETAYCGTSREDARVAYLREANADQWRGYGGPCRTTVIEAFASEPDEIASTEAEAVPDEPPGSTADNTDHTPSSHP